MKKSSILRKVFAVALSAVTLLGTGFTTAGQFVGTSVSVSAAETLAFGDFEYSINNDTTVTITKYTGNGGDVVIPDIIDGKSVTKIGESAFSECTSLISITISDSVTSIDDGAFLGCTSLKNIKIPNNITSIGWAVFSGCEGLKNVTIGSNVTSIGEDAFTGCTGLTSIVIPNSVTSIGSFAFDYCTGLTSITIPDSVNEIGRYAFAGCKNLTIYGIKGSCAETYANNNNIPFVVVLMNTSTLSSNEITLGQTVTVNAKASEDNCTYAVLYKKKTDTKWTVKQNYSTNDTIVVKPAKATDYDVCVKVKNGTGKIVKKFFEVKVNAKLKNTSTISATTIKKGDTVTLNGSATGGMGGYTYAVLYKKKAETKWTTRQGYKDNSEILVRPYTNTDYDICIKVKDNDGTIAKKYFTVTVTK